MIKVLIATGVYPPESGGPAIYSKFLNDNLPKEDFEVEVLPFLLFSMYPKVIRHFTYFFAVVKKARKMDIIYAQDPVSAGFPAFLVAKLLRKRFILRLGGDYAWEQGTLRFGVTDSLDNFSKKYGSYPLMVRILKDIQHFVVSQTKTIVVPSRYLKNIVMNWDIKEENIVVVYNAFLAPEVTSSKEELRKKLKLDGSIVLSAGRLVPWKGFSRLIDTFSEIIKKDKDIKLYILGDGPEREALTLKVAQYKLQDKVIFLGRLSHNETLEYIKAADVFILNTFYEGMSHILLEAMAMGTPIATTRAGGNKELIMDKENGLIFEHDDKEEMEDAVFELLKNKDMAKKHTDNGKKTLEKFKSADVLDKTIEILRKV